MSDTELDTTDVILREFHGVCKELAVVLGLLDDALRESARLRAELRDAELRDARWAGSIR